MIDRVIPPTSFLKTMRFHSLHTLLGLLAVPLIGCRDRSTAAAPPAALPAVDAAPPATVDEAPPADSLALKLPGGTEVWLTAGRMAKSATGAACRERGIELRTGSAKVAVPQVYTREPLILGRGGIQVMASDHCASEAMSFIDPATGQPSDRLHIKKPAR